MTTHKELKTNHKIFMEDHRLEGKNLYLYKPINIDQGEEKKVLLKHNSNLINVHKYSSIVLSSLASL
jgi:hypothetical protein